MDNAINGATYKNGTKNSLQKKGNCLNARISWAVIWRIISIRNYLYYLRHIKEYNDKFVHRKISEPERQRTYHVSSSLSMNSRTFLVKLTNQ